MRPKAKLLLKFASNNGFQLFLDVLLNFCALKRSPGLNWHLKLKLCTLAHHFFNKFQLSLSQETVNVLHLVFSGF